MEVTGVDINNLMSNKVVVYKEYKVIKGLTNLVNEFDYLAEKLGLEAKKELYVFSKGNNNLVISVDDNINIYKDDLVALINALFKNIEEFHKECVTIGEKNYFNLRTIIETYNRIIKLDFEDSDTVGKVAVFNESSLKQS